MSKSTRAKRLRDETQAAVKQAKQRTLEGLPEARKKEYAKPVKSEIEKQIIITEISKEAKEDEIALKIGFKLSPSRIAFSTITADLYFDEIKLNSMRIGILQGPLATEDSEFKSVLNMRGISAGLHIIRVEMYELSFSGEKLSRASKEVTVEYAPVRKENVLVKIPSVKSIAGADLRVVSDTEKDIYRELDEEMRKEVASKRDEW